MVVVLVERDDRAIGGIDKAVTIVSTTSIYLCVYVSLVDTPAWNREAAGSNPATQTKPDKH